MVFFLHESLRLSARDAVSGMWGAPFQPTVSLDPTRYSRKTLGEYLKKTPSGVSDPDSLNPDPYKVCAVSGSNPDSDQESLLHLHIKRTVRLLFFPVNWGLFWRAWIRIGTPHLDPLTQLDPD